LSDRCILAVKFTPAAPPAALRKAVGGFMRYVQYRDRHADSPDPGAGPDTKVSGLLKYVAHRDRATEAGRLFGPEGPAGDAERRQLAAFVARGIGATKPQRVMVDGKLVDRRRAVYRFVLSPEHAQGLDLRRLTEAAVRRLERESQVSGLRWMAAEHRNTFHPHVHLVLAGVREISPGQFRGFVLTPRRLAAMKDELTLEIPRQRGLELDPMTSKTRPKPSRVASRSCRVIRVRVPAGRGRRLPSLFLQLQLAALRYRRRIEREAEVEAARLEREWSR
jgi:hypothetical protein